MRSFLKTVPRRIGALGRVPVLRASVAQGFAFLVIQLARPLLPPATTALVWLVLHGAVAAAFGHGLGLPRWWLPINLLAPLALALALALGLGGWFAGAMLLALLLVFGGGLLTRVPLYLSTRAVATHLAALLPDPGSSPCRAVDLGAGLGGPMRWLTAARPDAVGINVEASPMTALLAGMLAAWAPGRRVQTVWGDLFGHHLGDYDLIYAFLSPQPMAELYAKFRREARPGACFVSNTFPVPAVIPERTIPLPGRDDAVLYVYRQAGAP